MVAAVLVLGAQTLMPGAALAAKGVVYPPGNSGVSQYDEDLPTVHGAKPTSSVVVPTNTGGSGGTGSGTAGGTGGSTGSASASGEAVIPTAVVKRLYHEGNAGKAAAALAEATAQAPASSGKPATPQSPKAPATSVIDALSGSTGGGGLGTLLPVLLIAALVIVSAVGLFQRRRST